MKRSILVLIGCCVAGIAGEPALAGGEYCNTVNGRYSVYANGDRLWVVGSRHLLIVVIDPLDKKLEKAGWEQTAAYGEFTICSERAANPLDLTITDNIRVKAYSHIRLARR